MVRYNITILFHLENLKIPKILANFSVLKIVFHHILFQFDLFGLIFLLIFYFYI